MYFTLVIARMNKTCALRSSTSENTFTLVGVSFGNNLGVIIWIVNMQLTIKKHTSN